MPEGKKGRRRRSSSLIYHEPLETMEQLSDQSALPNLNANWVNAKGKLYVSYHDEATLVHLFPQVSLGRLELLFCAHISYLRMLTSILTQANLFFFARCMDDPYCSHHYTQNSLQHHPRGLSRNILDPYQHNLHVRLLSYVSLRAWCAV